VLFHFIGVCALRVLIVVLVRKTRIERCIGTQ
jgi:hypothetical protein